MNIKEELKSGGDKLSFFQALYRDAEARLEESFYSLERHYEQYKGSPAIDGPDGMRVADASLVRNITYELIESQITGYTPSAKVDARMSSNKTVKNAEAIEKLCEMTMNRVGIEAMNDIDERYTYIYGGSIWLLEWDESIVTHNTVGDVRITCISPRNFVPQPKIFNVQDMEYCFVKFNTTKEDIVRKYGVTVEIAEEAEPEDGEGEDTATLYVCYYKDDDGKVCEYVWSGDTEVLDIDDFYARKRRVCTKCGKREGHCECAKPKFQLVSEDFEELDHDIIIYGEVVIPAQSEKIVDGRVATEEVEEVATNEKGIPQFDLHPDGSTSPIIATVPKPITENTKLPFYRPDRLPIVIRKNTSQEDSLLGQSDCEFIRPQQQAINKIESRILDKLLKAAITPIMPEDASIALNNSIFGQVIKMKPGETASQYGKVDTTPDITRDIAEAERLYDHAKRILGISDSFQGQHDASAASGVAKQLQINQASGRLESKRKMKNYAYSEIYEIIFKYYLAYADEPRPISFKDATGKIQNVQFNRYAFIERDEAGEYYYNDEYLFAADNASDVERYRQYLWEQNMDLYRQGAFGDPSSIQTRLTYWRNMERSHYPFAHAMVEETEAQYKDELTRLQAEMSSMNQETSERKNYEQYLRSLAGGVGR